MAAECAATYLNLAYPIFLLPCVVLNESEANHRKNWKTHKKITSVRQVGNEQTNIIKFNLLVHPDS